MHVPNNGFGIERTPPAIDHSMPFVTAATSPLCHRQEGCLRPMPLAGPCGGSGGCFAGSSPPTRHCGSAQASQWEQLSTFWTYDTAMWAFGASQAGRVAERSRGKGQRHGTLLARTGQSRICGTRSELALDARRPTRERRTAHEPQRQSFVRATWRDGVRPHDPTKKDGLGGGSGLCRRPLPVRRSL
jgi:hypothetical protein